MDPVSIATLAAAMMPLLKGLFSRGNTGQQSATDTQALLRAFPQLQQMLDLQTQEAQRRAPLQQAMINLSTRLLPRSAFGQGPQAAPLSGMPPSQSGVPTPTWPHGNIRDFNARHEGDGSRIMDSEPGMFPSREQGFPTFPLNH